MKYGLIIYLGLLVFGCNNNSKAPDVSNIQVEVNIERFDKSLFRIDTNNILNGLKNLETDFPNFYPDFMRNILQVQTDTSFLTYQVTKDFLSSYYALYDSLKEKFENINLIEKKIKNGFKYVKYYFPTYKLPRVITFIGPLDAPGIALTEYYLAIGLQQYCGKDFFAYKSPDIQQLYPAYISRRFDQQYIPVNSLKIVVEDLFHDKSTGKGLIEQMIEKGKQWWLLDHFMPDTPDSLKTGFTDKQLEWCIENEGLVWNYIIQNENLYTIEPRIIQTYIGEAPFTQGMPEASPGNIGQWIGWRIIQKFADKNPSLSLTEVMKTDAKKILDEAKYKPK